MGMAKLPEMLKPAAAGEETPISSLWISRGDWRRRVGKEKSRNLRGPIPAAALGRESDDPIVAKKGLTRRERRGSAVSKQQSRQDAAA